MLMLHGAWSVCVVAVLVRTVSSAKTAEPIEMAFGGSDLGGSKKVHVGVTWQIRLNDTCEAAMRAVAK